ncbi:MAG TPA: UDP-glycosyltransferase [Flavobacterium sp.]|nr:UDP-glycosyltransferase [Flavobacterium sp.]
MKNGKVLILLPDGIGLRNFAYSNFYKSGTARGFEPLFWNNTPFDLASLGFDEIKIKKAKTHPLTDIYKNARKHIELNHFIKKTGNPVYRSYLFPFEYKNIRIILKNFATRFTIALHSSKKGLQNVREKIKRQERKTAFYQDCLEMLKKEKPALVFCTNQRPMLAIAPLLAAQDLNIPTASFIFSWDNLPKATMVVETDYYFVWSDYMKSELLYYYDYISESQVFVAGTPQFEYHFNRGGIASREEFYACSGLDSKKRYICFSGDDITTSPDDPQYLADAADAVRNLNEQGYNLGIIFRRCPVDFSARYNKVLAENQDIIFSIAPLWKKMGNAWNTILPTKEDSILLQNTIAHTEMVINLGSSMVFDYACFEKPCVYINYDASEKSDAGWSVEKIYQYVHFQSMPSRQAVLWCHDKMQLAEIIAEVLEGKLSNVGEARHWLEKIAGKNPEQASENIWDAVKKIIN